MSLMALALGSGLLSTAGAQQYPASNDQIRLYSQPLESEETAPAPVSPPPSPAIDTSSKTMPVTEESPQYPQTYPQQQPPQYSQTYPQQSYPQQQQQQPQYPQTYPQQSYPQQQQQQPQYPQTYPQQRPSYSDDDTGPGWSPPSGFLRIQNYQGIRYVSGGVGEGELDEINALSGQFNLRLLFAMQGSGNYLADVQVTIVNARGEIVLNATSNGPWFLVQLSPGDYTVDATTLEQPQRQTAHVDGGTRQSRLNFYWR